MPAADQLASYVVLVTQGGPIVVLLGVLLALQRGWLITAQTLEQSERARDRAEKQFDTLLPAIEAVLDLVKRPR